MTMPPFVQPSQSKPPQSKMSLVALFLGIGALLSFWTVLGGIVFGVAAIIVGLLGRSQAKLAGAPAGAATGGVVTGAIATVGAVAFTAWAVTHPVPKTEAKSATVTMTAVAVQPTVTTPQPTVTTDPPTTTTLISTATPTPEPSPPARDGTRGIMSVTAYWDQRFTKATKGDCLDQGEDNLGSGVGWWITPSVLFCAFDPNSVTTWQGHLINGHLHFATPVDANTATRAALQLLPDDSNELRQVQGQNPDWSKVSNGTCKSIEYHSDTLAKIVASINPTWRNADKAEFNLYSGTSSSDVGSDTPYDGSHVREVLVGIGALEANPDGRYPC
ncbi:hypothetical protein [Nocardia heshunensis]